MVEARLWHARTLASTLRRQDREEVEALGLNPHTVLCQSVSRDTNTALAGEKVLAMFGAAPFTDDVGAVWMLGSDELLKHGTALLRTSKAYVDKWRTEYRSLMNYVDCRNTVSIKWLKWLGASFHLPTPYGLNGKPFMPFYFGEDPFVR